MNKLAKHLLLSVALFAQTQMTHAVPVSYSVSGSTYAVATGREVAITGSLTFESESIASGIDPWTGYTANRRWNILSGSLSSTDFFLHDITGYIWLVSGGVGNLYDEMYRLRGEGSDVSFQNWYTGVRFYDLDGNYFPWWEQGAIDAGYSQLAPMIRLGSELEGYTASRERIYQGGELWLTQIPVPASVWLFGPALGLMGVIRRKAVA